jgi:hypothetical protein
MGKIETNLNIRFFFFIVYLTRSKERNLDLTWWPIKSIRNAAYLHFLHFNVVHVISNKTLSFWFWCIVESISWYFDYDIWKFDSFKSQGLNKNKTFVSWILTSSRMVEWSTKSLKKTFFTKKKKKKNHSVFIFSISVSMKFFFFCQTQTDEKMKTNANDFNFTFKRIPALHSLLLHSLLHFKINNPTETTIIKKMFVT